MKSVIHSSRIAIQNPEDYEARSNIMWTATWALNTLIAQGKATDWMVHMLEGIADGTFIMEGGYKILTRDEILDILKASM